MSREQHRHRRRRCTLGSNPVAPIGLPYPHMGCFKFLAACHLLNFSQNHKSRNRGSCFEFMAPLTRSKAKPVRTIEPGKKRKRPGLWKKKKRTGVMEQIGKELEDANRLQSEDKDMSGKCELCEVLKGKDLFVIHCQHQFCRECLEKQISQLMALKAEDFTLARTVPRITCPLSRCNVELSELELVDLVGKERAVGYISQLLSHYDCLYQPILNKEMRIFCPNSTCDRNTPSAISASYISQLNNSEVQQALMARGLVIKQTRSSKHKLLLDFIGWKKKSNATSWICTTCNAAWCGTCGLSLPITERTTDSEFHLECDRQSPFELYSQLSEMRDVFEAFTCGKDSQNQRKEIVFKSSSSESQKTVWARGTGFGGGATTKSQIDSWQTAARRAELDFDKHIEKALGYLAEILEEEATKAGEFPALGLTVSSLFTWRNILSRVLVHLASNDSMLDIMERKGLYFKMVSLINAICMHKELIPLVSKTESSLDETFSNNLGSRSILLNKMQNIYNQSKIMLHHSSHAADSENLDISLAGALFKCYENLQNFVELHSKGVSLKDVETGLEMKQLVSAYIGKLKSLQFRLLSMADQDGNYKHYFKNHIEGNLPCSTSIDNGGVHNHKRMLHISKEIASLATTLPLEWESSIHVCVDEKRMDVLRALIIGPHGTPYQNGIFIFDIFLPPDYPQQPPQVQFLTTGGGTVRFNPNLYDSGKVCLSLLGTWNGPGWIPGKSTLLQVLVSIQSLIFVSNPYYNEPGYERVESNNAEIENTRHRENTLSLAILCALRKPEVLFTELILEHFRYKCQEVEQQCNEWVESASNPTVKSRMEYTARGIKAELKALKRMR